MWLIRTKWRHMNSKVTNSRRNKATEEHQTNENGSGSSRGGRQSVASRVAGPYITREPKKKKSEKSRTDFRERERRKLSETAPQPHQQTKSLPWWEMEPVQTTRLQWKKKKLDVSKNSVGNYENKQNERKYTISASSLTAMGTPSSGPQGLTSSPPPSRCSSLAQYVTPHSKLACWRG